MANLGRWTSPWRTVTFLVLALLLIKLGPALSAADNSGPLVTIRQGAVRGKSMEVLGEELDIFRGLPFAKPPLGDLRFKAPETKVDSWQGERDGTNFRPSCIQDMTDQHVPGQSSEDCLYLNVYTPTNATSKSLPVLFWIYGGSFRSGSATIYDGSALAVRGQVVVVTINYRLGAFGFLATGSSDVVGNAGLLDQQAALMWVQENIASFGGDPSMVTISGESAGAASVSLHLLSPGSEKLFRRAISESGSLTAPWAAVSHDRAMAGSLALSKQLGCGEATQSWDYILRCLRGRTASDVLAAQKVVYGTYTIQNLGFPFSPVVALPFLPGKPYDLLRQGRFKKTEYLSGVNRNEYSLFLMRFAGKYLQVNAHGDATTNSTIFDEFTLKLVSSADGLTTTLPVKANTAMTQTAIFEYTDWMNETSGLQRVQQIIDMGSDLFFKCPVSLLAKTWTGSANRAQGTKLFVYTFSHVSGIYPPWAGVPHSGEIIFVFGAPLLTTSLPKTPDATGKPTGSLTFTDADRAVSSQVITMWTNFAKTG